MRMFAGHFRDIAPDQLTLKGVSKDRSGKWVLNVIRPEDWLYMRDVFCEFEVIPPTIGETGREFLEGQLWLTVGRKQNGRMVWSKVQMFLLSPEQNRGKEGEPATPWIARPSSFEVRFRHRYELQMKGTDADNPFRRRQWNLYKKLPKETFR